MGQGRGSARSALVVGLAILCLLAIVQPTVAAVYNIGWSFNVNGARGKTFRAGDVLVFKYIKGQHNVVAVNGRGYASCSAPRGARTYSSGQDRIKLTRGQNYFICSFPGHCGGGMKIAINAK